jgi:signal transduction histidine kinase
VEFYAEHLDASRFPEERHYRLFREYLQEKYAQNPPDVIVAFLITKFELAGRLPAELFPGIPVVLGALTEDEVPDEGFGNRVMGVVQRIDFQGALELILKLQPDTERIVVIGGTAPLDRRYLGRTEEAARSLAGRVRFDYWANYSVAEMRQAVASLPSRTVIFFTTVFRDPTGKSFLPASVASMLAASSSVPVYVVADSLIGGGTVGGLVAHLDALGRHLGELAQQVLGGTAPAALPIEVRKDGVPIFDWRALKRWGISESRLPADSIIRFRELTIWQQYRWHIMAVAALCLAQSVLISGLLIQRRRRRLAEGEAASLAGRLITAHEDERRRLARDLHDDLTQRLARLAIDAGKIERSAPASNHDEPGRSMREELVRLSEDVHALSYRLHPSLLDDLGLVDALNAECDGFSRRESIPVEFKPRDVPRDVRPDTALCLFRVAQESLRNVARHAGASAVEVSLRKVDGGLEMAVRDNGTGFDPTTERARHSLGLASMKERVHLLGGELDIDSEPGHGTTVIAWVRLNGEGKS